MYMYIWREKTEIITLRQKYHFGIIVNLVLVVNYKEKKNWVKRKCHFGILSTICLCRRRSCLFSNSHNFSSH